MAVVLGPTIWQFINNLQLGQTALGGGNTICKNGGIVWIVAPASSQVSRTWYCRNDAITTATACTSSSTWFIPTVSQLQNPGYLCRTFWDSFSSTCYWSSTENNAFACNVYFTNGNANGYGGKTSTRCVRAFRCVTY